MLTILFPMRFELNVSVQQNLTINPTLMKLRAYFLQNLHPSGSSSQKIYAITPLFPLLFASTTNGLTLSQTLPTYSLNTSSQLLTLLSNLLLDNTYPNDFPSNCSFILDDVQSALDSNLTTFLMAPTVFLPAYSLIVAILLFGHFGVSKIVAKIMLYLLNLKMLLTLLITSDSYLS